MGLALQNYHDVLRTFPPALLGNGYLGGSAANQATYKSQGYIPQTWVVANTTGFVLLLPYLEQQPLYSQ